ncbi:MAG: outer membrane beta-barrel protein [Smithellaceae bacterium]|nr:outer membrane beta-barrel protein [Smithellaceae bacterium]
MAKKIWPLLLWLCMSGTALAAGNIRYGSLEIHPYLIVKESYTDNVFATATDTKKDWVNTTTPGIKLLLPFRMHQLALEYNAVVTTYADFGSENTTDHNASAVADLKFGSLFSLKLSDIYQKGHEPRLSTTSGQIEQYETNAAALSATYKLADRSKVQLDYARTNWRFMLSDYRDRAEDLMSAYVYYRFLPKTSAFVEYDYKNIVYNRKANGLDSVVHTAFLGLTWEVSEYTKGTVKGGYLQKDFEDRAKKNLNTWSASIDLNHAFSDDSSLKLVGHRAANESSALGARYFVTTGAFAEYTHKLTHKISGFLRGSYGTDEYSDAVAPDPEARSDKTILSGVGLKYQMRDWLEFVLDFNYRNRDSNIASHDMVERAYALTINFAL